MPKQGTNTSDSDAFYQALQDNDAKSNVDADRRPLNAAFLPVIPATINALSPSQSSANFSSTLSSLTTPPSSSSIVVAECAKLLSTATSDEVFRAASVYIYDGLGLRAIHHGLSQRSLHWYMFRQSLWWFTLMRALCIVQLSLALIEPPSSFDWGIDRRTSAIIELLILLVYVFDTYLSYLALTRAGFIKSKFRQLKCVSLIVCIIDSLWTIVTNDRQFRVTRLLRAYFLIERSGRLRRVLKSLLRAAPVIGNVLFLLVIHVLCFGFIGWMLFAHLERSDPSGAQCRANTAISEEQVGLDTEKCYFQDLNAAFLNLFILLTNANFPDIMMPSYRANRFAVLFFTLFLLIGLYLLMQLVLAVIFHTFKNHTVRDVNYYAQRADRAFRASFYLLGQVEARTQYIHFNSFFHVMRIIRPSIKQEQARVMFDSVKVNDSANPSASDSDSLDSLVRADSINYQQFKDVCQLIHVRFRAPESEVEENKMRRLHREHGDEGSDAGDGQYHNDSNHSSQQVELEKTNEDEILSENSDHRHPHRTESIEEKKRSDSSAALPATHSASTIPANGIEASSVTFPHTDTSILDEAANSDSDDDDDATAAVQSADNDDAITFRPSLLTPLINYVTARAQGILTRRAVDLVIDFLCVLNTITIIVQAELIHIQAEGQARNDSDQETVSVLTGFQSFVFLSFFVELIIKLYLMRSSYFRSGFRCVDLYLFLLSAIGQLLWYSSTMLIPSFYLRPLRLLRIARVLKRLKAILHTLLAMLPALTPLLALQALVFYVFAIIGMALFCDKLTEDSVPAWTGLDYALSNYYANNFDNILRAYVTLFILLIGNNWYYVMDAAVYVTSQYAAFYFIVFYSMAVLVVMNVLTAFILEAFLMQQQREQTVKEQLKADRQSLATSGARGQVAQRYRGSEDAIVSEKANAVLPSCYSALRSLAWRRLGQVAELKAPTGMAAVLQKMYAMSIAQDGDAD